MYSSRWTVVGASRFLCSLRIRLWVKVRIRVGKVVGRVLGKVVRLGMDRLSREGCSTSEKVVVD